MTKGKEKAKMIDANTTPGARVITVPVATMRDSRLSPESRGMLAYLLTEPDRRRLPELLTAQGMGKNRAFRIIRELKGAGYLRVHAARRLPDGTQSGWWYELADRPGAFSTAE